MEQGTRLVVTVLIAFAGAIALFALVVYPFQYGMVESTVLVGLIVGFALFETVLDDAMG